MERVLVVLPNWFGETLFATPFLKALREQRPQLTIASLGWPQCREVLLHNPSLNEQLVYEERGAHRSLIGKWQLVRMLRAKRFDTAFILRNSLSRTLLAALAGIKTRIGFANAKSGWLLTRRVPASSVPVHKAASYLPLLEAAGLSATRHSYDYTVSEEERRAASRLIEAGGRTPLVILHPGANWPHKRWLPERFAALGDRLVVSHQARIVVTGAPADGELAESLRRSMRQPSASLVGRTTLRTLAGCLERAQLVVSNDTGVSHIAAALGTPLVALYGPTSPLLTGPLGDPTRTAVLHHPDCCPAIPCYAPDRPEHPGMSALTVDEVYEAAKQLLDDGSRKTEAGYSRTPDG